MAQEKRKFTSLEEMRAAFGQQPLEKEKNVANCKECGRPLKDAKYDTCYDCSQKRRAGPSGAGPQGGGGQGNFAPAKLPEGYLAHGYFYDAPDSAHDKNKKYLRDELITTQPLELAKTFARIGLTTGQLRRFYAHARYAGQRLEYGDTFEAVKPAILELQPMVAGAVGRANGNGTGDYELFKQFIDRNIKEASSSKDAFVQGFVPHFQYIVAYFTWLKPRG